MLSFDFETRSEWLPAAMASGRDPQSYLRKGVRFLVREALVKGGGGRVGDSSALAGELEERCFELAQQHPNPRDHYTAGYHGLCRGLPELYGDFLESTLAVNVAEGRVPVWAAVTPEVYNAHRSVDPRKHCRALFYKILGQDPRFNEKTRRDFASQIERGCYNAVIDRCMESADSYRRHWDSPMFLNVYSSRCGLVSANIDPGGAVVEEVGESWALDQLASGAWLPESLGAMTAAELCPQAGRAERDEVARRLNQKVEEKTSSLFACPRCCKRNHTYRQVQIGCADELSVFMCTCKECGENFEGHD